MTPTEKLREILFEIHQRKRDLFFKWYYRYQEEMDLEYFFITQDSIHLLYMEAEKVMSDLLPRPLFEKKQYKPVDNFLVSLN